MLSLRPADRPPIVRLYESFQNLNPMTGNRKAFETYTSIRAIVPEKRPNAMHGMQKSAGPTVLPGLTTSILHRVCYSQTRSYSAAVADRSGLRGHPPFGQICISRLTRARAPLTRHLCFGRLQRPLRAADSRPGSRQWTRQIRSCIASSHVHMTESRPATDDRLLQWLQVILLCPRSPPPPSSWPCQSTSSSSARCWWFALLKEASFAC